MQQFTVPQFIDVEDKIIGPVTTRQFLVMLVAFIICGISYKIFDFTLFIIFSVFTMIIFGVIAFLPINGMPFHYFILNFMQTYRRPKKRVWNSILAKRKTAPEAKEVIISKTNVIPEVRRMSTSRLAELSLIVDTRGSYQGEESTKTENIKQIQ